MHMPKEEINQVIAIQLGVPGHLVLQVCGGNQYIA